MEQEREERLRVVQRELLDNLIQETARRRRIEEELRLANARLAELLRFKTEILRLLSHELGNPLTPIKLQLELLRTTGKNLNDGQLRSLEIIRRNLERIEGISQDMLDVARLETGHLRVIPRRVDLAGLVDATARGYEEAAKRAHLALEARSEHDLWLYSDPGRVSQVLDNLLGNAIKFTPAGGRVTLEALREDGEVVVHVTDTGVGFTLAQSMRLFQPFSRLHEEAPDAPAGSGLGLYLSKGIVEQLGGRLWAESPGPGHGARFTFTLAASAQEATA